MNGANGVRRVRRSSTGLSLAHRYTSLVEQVSDVPSSRKASLSANFLIIGGGIAGLSAAVALSRVGHRVTLVERDADFRATPKVYRGIRMPPNMTKIFNHWGMRSWVDEIGVVSDQVILSRIENAWTLGQHVWNREMLEEAGGEFIFLNRHDLRIALMTTAQSLGATIRTSAEVVSIGSDGKSATLRGGEVLTADVVVGATGNNSITQNMLGCDSQSAKPMNLMLFDAIIPGDRVRADPELRSLVDQDLITQWVWFGDRHAALFFPIGNNGDCSLYFYAPDDGKSVEEWGDVVAPNVVAAYAANFEPRIQKLASLATASRVKAVNRPVCDEWVHRSGRFVGIGEAVHPFVPGNIQGACMSLEDASVLAKLFSHLLAETQIPNFLYAFEEIRQARCSKIQGVDNANIGFMTLPDGDHARMRDEMMRAKYDAGGNALGGDDEDDTTSSQWADNREIFGYDAEDEADNWWVQWGLLRLRATAAADLHKVTGLSEVQKVASAW